MAAVAILSRKILACGPPSPMKEPPLVYVEGYGEQLDKVPDPSAAKAQPDEAEAGYSGGVERTLGASVPVDFFMRETEPHEVGADAPEHPQQQEMDGAESGQGQQDVGQQEGAGAAQEEVHAEEEAAPVAVEKEKAAKNVSMTVMK